MTLFFVVLARTRKRQSLTIVEYIMRWTVFLGILTCAAVGSAAHAAPPAAVADTDLNAENTNFGPGSYYHQESSNLEAAIAGTVPESSASASTSASQATVAVSGDSFTVSNGDSTSTQSIASLNYFYTVVGATEAVPVDIAYYVSASLTRSGSEIGSESSDAYIDVQGNFIGTGIVDVDGDGISYMGTSTGSSVRSGTLLTRYLTNETYGEIRIGAMETSDGDGQRSSQAAAYVDPYIYIDPTFLAANPGVSLQISSGVGNSPLGSAVPEPASWLLMTLGICAVGLGLRKAKREIGAPQMVS